MAREVRVRKVEFQYWNMPNKHRIKVWFAGKGFDNYAYISPCHESYEVYHATHDQAVACGPIARKYNDYLHGYCPNE